MKTLIIALVALIAGGIAGYYIAAQKCGSSLVELDTKKISFVKPDSEVIPDSIARNLIREYQEQNKTLKLKTTDNNLLKGFFIDSAAVNSMVRQFGKEFVGISIYLAKHPKYRGSAENTFTIIASGAKKIEKPISGRSDIMYQNGTMWEYVDPCPTNCGTGDGSIDPEFTTPKVPVKQ